MSGGELERKTFAENFLAEASEIIAKLNVASIEKAAGLLASTRAAGGRLFILGVGGSAANASHAVNDFRKIAGIEAYAPTDNVSELTARTNDEGWSSVFDSWLRVSRLRAGDLLLVLSVGGGNLEQNVSPNLVAALKYAKSVGAKIIGVVGRDGGYTATVADACVLIPTVNPAHTTPHTEAFQAVIWHLLVSHPTVKMQATKWESMAPSGKRRAVFLDRDGVINRAFVRDGKPFPPPTQQELEVLPGVPEALRELKSQGYQLIVVTNQPDVGRGMLSRQTLDAMHQTLLASLPLDDILVCCHTDQENCDCRKPKPGMLLEAARKHNIDLSASFMVGDRWRDIDAGYNAGCKTILIDYGYSERAPDHEPDLRVSSLREAADWIIRSTPEGVHPA
ncbi:MAG TPA: HAD-IIIA family hydrolase [Candidatus Sulfotelmatobacter sp.]|jgi:D-sedoheptulose 7-phosphate isomerase|nr:HAD-IIIA family hydrolase [Candidatus Sulfotelmatobacter sp.]